MKRIWLLLFAVLSFTSVYATGVECPFGLTNDPAPGNCGLYVDANTDNLCDLSQTGLETHQGSGHVDACDASGEISSTELKTMTLSQVAGYYNIEATVLMQAIENKVNGKLSLDESMQTIHDTYSLPMREVKTIVAGVLSQDKVPSVASISFDFFGYIKDMHIVVLLGWVIFMVLYYFFDTFARKQPRKILSFESNIVLLFVPLASLARYFLSTNPLLLGTWRGYAALRLLWLLLISRPLLNILMRKGVQSSWLLSFIGWVVAHRKRFGIIMFRVAGMHSFIYLILRFKLGFFWSNALTWMGATGIVGLITALLAYVTSNKYSMCKLKTGWKKLQMVVYATLFASVLHVIFVNFERGMILVGFTVVRFALWLWAKKLMAKITPSKEKKC